MNVTLDILLVAVVVAMACALPGTFLVLRRMAMLSDAISHAVLPGLVVGFLLSGRVSSPLVVVGGALAGVTTALLVQVLSRSGRTKEDAAIGLVFPFLFALGVVMVAQFADRVHLDTDAVLLGELAFVPFDRVRIGGLDAGPRALWEGAVLLTLNVAFVWALGKELAHTTFDAVHAATLGLAPALVQLALVTVVSVTAVGAFDAVGSVLVVAFFAGPPATALLFARRLDSALLLALAIAAGCALAGYGAARALDVSIAGAMSVVVGVVFAGASVVAPESGWWAQRKRLAQQRRTFAVRALAVHLATHENGPDADIECTRPHLAAHVGWSASFASAVVADGVTLGWITSEGDRLALTPAGRAVVAGAVVGVHPG